MGLYKYLYTIRDQCRAAPRERIKRKNPVKKKSVSLAIKENIVNKKITL